MDWKSILRAKWRTRKLQLRASCEIRADRWARVSQLQCTGQEGRGGQKEVSDQCLYKTLILLVHFLPCSISDVLIKIKEQATFGRTGHRESLILGHITYNVFLQLKIHQMRLHNYDPHKHALQA